MRELGTARTVFMRSRLPVLTSLIHFSEAALAHSSIRRKLEASFIPRLQSRPSRKLCLDIPGEKRMLVNTT